MNVHKNAPLTPKGREAMVRSVVEGGPTQAAAADLFNASTTPLTNIALAGIPLGVNTGGTPVVSTAAAPPAYGLFAQGNRDKTVFSVVPSGVIKGGYDFTDMLSLTVAYNYLYMSHVGRVADQIASPTDIRQSSIFAQGITFGAKVKF
jgi:hypothetical protein